MRQHRVVAEPSGSAKNPETVMAHATGTAG